MQILLGFLSSMFVKGFGFLAARLGIAGALNVSLFAVWYGLIASVTAVSYSCFSVTGSCSAYTNFAGLSQWVKFGLSLVPIEALTIISCLLSLHLAGWCYSVLVMILKVKTKTASTALTLR